MSQTRTFGGELRSVIATLHCLAELAAEQGDARSAAILGNTAALLLLTVASEGDDMIRLASMDRPHPDQVAH